MMFLDGHCLSSFEMKKKKMFVVVISGIVYEGYISPS